MMGGLGRAIQGYPCLLKPSDFQSKSVQKRRKKRENLRKYCDFLMFGRQNLVHVQNLVQNILVFIHAVVLQRSTAVYSSTDILLECTQLY